MSLKDPTAVDRYFGESFIQHDPNLADGRAGMKSFAAEVASSPAADITIYRTLVDGDLVLLHSKYQGVGRYARTAIAFDLFRFSGGKIAEHWGGQEPEELPNSSRCFDLSGLSGATHTLLSCGQSVTAASACALIRSKL